MKIIETIKPEDIPEKKYNHKKYLPVQKAVSTLSPGEVLKIQCDYASQGYVIKKKMKQWFPHQKIDVTVRKVGEFYYAYIHMTGGKK